MQDKIMNPKTVNDPDYKIFIEFINSSNCPTAFLTFCEENQIDLQNIPEVNLFGEYSLEKFNGFSFFYQTNYQLQENYTVENTGFNIIIKNGVGFINPGLEISIMRKNKTQNVNTGSILLKILNYISFIIILIFLAICFIFFREQIANDSPLMTFIYVSLSIFLTGSFFAVIGAAIERRRLKKLKFEKYLIKWDLMETTKDLHIEIFDIEKNIKFFENEEIYTEPNYKGLEVYFKILEKNLLPSEFLKFTNDIGVNLEKAQEVTVEFIDETYLFDSFQLAMVDIDLFAKELPEILTFVNEDFVVQVGFRPGAKYSINQQEGKYWMVLNIIYKRNSKNLLRIFH